MNFLETIGFWVIIIIGVVILYLTISRYKSKLNEKATLLIYGNEEIREIYNSKTRNSYYHNSEDKKIFGKVYSIKGDPYQIEKTINKVIFKIFMFLYFLNLNFLFHLYSADNYKY